MSTHYSNLLRRTLFTACAGLVAAASLPAASQGTVTLSTGASCSYSQMTVQPNGSINVSCQTTSTPLVANFGVSAPASSPPNTAQTFVISRTGGPAGALGGSWALTGACTSSSGTSGSYSLSEGGQLSIVYVTGASGVCTISITAPSTHTASPSMAATTITTGGTGGPTPPAGCAAPDPAVTLAKTLDYGPVDQLRMKSGVTAHYPVIPQPDSRYASVEFTQGQQPNTPGDAVTEFSVSKCPGVIDTSVPDCYYKSGRGQVNSNKITIYTRAKPEWGWTNQASMAGYGCLADATQGTYYVNVRWTYPSCVWGDNNCGFSMQWSLGAW